MENEGQSQQMDIDSLLAEVEAPSAPRPEGEAGTPQTNQPQTQPQETAAERMLKINWRGAEKEVPESTVIRGYQQTYDLDQRNRAFKEERAAFEQRQAELREQAEQLGELKKFDDFARQTPGFREEVAKLYQQFVSGQQIPEGVDPNDPLVQQNLKLQNQVSELMQWKQNLETEREMTEAQSAEAELNKDTQAVRDEFKEIDFDAVNDQGESVENQIIKYGIENGIPKFRTAALEYLFPTILKVREERARKVASDEIVNKNKLGIVGRGATQARTVPASTDVRGKNYDQLAEEALREYGAG